MNACIGIDMGGTRLKTGIVHNNRIIARSVVSAESGSTFTRNLELLRAEIEKLKRVIDPEIEILDAALGFPGLVDYRSGRVLSTNAKYDDAKEINIPAWFRENCNLHVKIENDARVAAIGEWKYGSARTTDNFVAVTIGTGLGSAVMMEGKLLRGKHFQAGCLGGHISVDYNGRHCTCTNQGCAEAYASTWSIRQRIENDPAFFDSLLSQQSQVDFESLFYCAGRGDALAIYYVDDCIKVWSASIVNLIHAYDPDLIVIGGGAMNDHKNILPAITERVHAQAWTPWGNVEIRSSELLSDAGIFGAAWLANNEV